MYLSVYSKLCLFTSISAFFFMLWKWYPNQKQVKQKHLIPGLINNGNTCFMNTMLQCLASVSYLVPWLNKVCCVCHSEGRVFLAKPLSDIILRLSCKDEEDFIDPSSLLNHLISSGWFISSEEHDAHEFLHCVLSTLDDELRYAVAAQTFPNFLLLLEKKFAFSSIPSDCRLLKYYPNYKNIFSLFKCHPFRGLLDIRLCCSKCNQSNPVIFESFHSLSLPIESCISNNLVSCLRSFFSCELLSDVQCKMCTDKKSNAFGCSNPVQNSSKRTVSCSNLVLTERKIAPSRYVTKTKRMNEKKMETSSFLKQCHIAKFPYCLCIHLKRLVWKLGQPVKLHQPIKYPEILDLTEFKFRRYAKNEQLNNYLNPIVVSLLKSRPETGDSFLKSRLSYLARHSAACNDKFFTKPSNRKLYQLTGVIVHYGDWNSSGHFIAYRRHLFDDDCGNTAVQWFYTSDNFVRKSSLSEVLNQSAYMLFYQKIN